ncbi:penicillin-binding protein 1C [Hymenobacter psychrotolerans]|uniref:peptidoglycan glycosyltransferase n=1 Tax=Hymenobacter psychrotolerans DSM 18569 TaxID=1121959 RepID=A0A1M7FXJ5_9BACT|nr:penicillin-binding protein 1C [Hymenobacter psychrotolerans]SHM08635.1 penicillin-binding protein 1C [Hymenobacter psychrotolerans DSM 18569]
MDERRGLTGCMKRAFKVLIGVAVVLALVGGLDLLFPLPPPPQYSPIVLAADGSVLHAYLNPTQKWRMKTELREITPVLRKAILEKEDRWFRWHFGVNPVALVQAAGRNLFGTGRTTGASTITMQVARLLEPKERTFGNKLLEMLRATQLELHYSKDEILQLYLNLVPYGGNVEGVKSAALLYFQQTPDYLSLAQTVTLAIIPNRPRGLVLGKNNAAVLQERNRWLNRLGEAGLFPKEAVEDALLEPLDVQRHAAPTLAPHLSRRLVRQFPRQAIIRSGLERGKQAKAEDLTRNYVRRLYELGITQAAVLVVNNRTRQVEAYVGSADFRDFANQGQNDGIVAVRSPGSTLKPFLYALAMDRGLVTPKQLLPDVPTNFQGYRPENFDKHCNGEVTLERALAYSLNIPAVRVLNQLGVPTFTDKLRQAGFQNVTRNRTRLGLSSILGGCGASLEELTNLYVTLAEGGQYSGLQLVSTRKGTSTSPLISEASAFLTTEILAQLTRPDLPINAASSMRLPKIAWKTGTSYGRRDAWSIGYNKQYTIGVWVGNFSGQGSPALTGSEVATPLLFDLFNTLAYNSPNDWFVPPAALDFRLVCTESGLVPGENCPNQIIDYFLPNVSSGQRCQHVREVLVSADGSFTYCRACAPAAGYRRELYPNLLPEVVAYKEAQGIPYRRLPPHNPQCQLVRGGAERAPSITSPTPNTEYVLNRHEKQQLLLTCTTDNEVRQVFWYVNDKFLQAAAPTERVFIKPPPGPLKISCADDHGRNTDVLVTVTEL